MGCCCPPQRNLNKDESNYLDESQAEGFSNASLEQKYREEGKKLFNQKNYEKAIGAYCLALKTNSRRLVNYTNLALSYKMAGRFYDSITTINKMLTLETFDSEQQKFIVKGKIIKCRSQIMLVKNHCVNNESESKQKAQDEAEAIILINDAINKLTDILQDGSSQAMGRSMLAKEFLEKAHKVQKFLKSKSNTLSKEDEQLLQFIEVKVEKEGSTEQWDNKVKQYFENSQCLLTYLRFQIKEVDKKALDQEENQDFLNDPITYQQFVFPVIVKSGITYQEATLKEHLAKNGSTDPITRQPLQNHQGNFGVRNHVIERYIKEYQGSNITKQDLMLLGD